MNAGIESSTEGMRIRIDGSVQGVGFRPWVFSLAREIDLRGRVWNDAEGVRIEVFGPHARLVDFLDSLRQPPIPAARVRDLHWESIPVQPFDSFDIADSSAGEQRRPSIPPDLALCDACRAEMRDPGDRRYAYPFINCTGCGPRYSICNDIPYDRERTTMGGFPMCDACGAEYRNPADRRFHAQPIACPDCGPTLRLVAADGAALGDRSDAIAAAAAMLRAGDIVAVKGLGGFHLACLATAEPAVAALRVRKDRDAKPFAVMFADLAEVRRYAVVGDQDAELLGSTARPIVLLRRQAAPRGDRIADAVAPDNPMIGAMLPYTPLHELLLAAVGQPLVMTSGNRRDEPMVTDDDGARQRLAGAIAEAVLLHDRGIANRCDDSVARVLDGQPVVLRRGRGWVPDALRLPTPAPRSILACGGHLKNTFCYASDHLAWLGPHVGDLSTHEACLDYEAMIERFGRFVGVEPQVIACDLHPDYHSTVWAMRLAERRGLPVLRVQHHHAHVASVMAEHGIDTPVLGLAWDGTGYGGDGSAWGSELLLANQGGFRRLGTFRPIALAGGETAIHEVWRIALAALDDAFDGDPPLPALDLFAAVDAGRVAAVRRMIAGAFNCPPAHGIGRWFDAFGAIALALPESRYEGEVAMRLTFAADGAAATDEPYPFDLDDARECAVVDLRPGLRAAVADLLGGRGAAPVARRFHATLVAGAAALIGHAARRTGDLPVVLSGGCFQNELLLAGVRRALSARHRVFTHRRVPPNDGGIAFGQAAVVAAVLRGERGPCATPERIH
jgi:hydrogenase maturation protein HypF